MLRDYVSNVLVRVAAVAVVAAASISGSCSMPAARIALADEVEDASHDEMLSGILDSVVAGNDESAAAASRQEQQLSETAAAVDALTAQIEQAEQTDLEQQQAELEQQQARDEQLAKLSEDVASLADSVQAITDEITADDGQEQQEPQEVDLEWLKRSMTNVEQLLMLANACAGVFVGYVAFKRVWHALGS